MRDANFVEGNEHRRIDGASIIETGSDDGLDVLDVFGFKNF